MTLGDLVKALCDSGRRLDDNVVVDVGTVANEKFVTIVDVSRWGLGVCLDVEGEVVSLEAFHAVEAERDGLKQKIEELEEELRNLRLKFGEVSS